MENKTNIFAVVLIILAICCVIFNNQISQVFSPQEKNNIGQENQTFNINKKDFYRPRSDIETYSQECFSPISLSGKSKKEIYDIRKQYVDNSIFSDKNYEPSEEVFGQIESGKPWISANVCKDPETHAMRTSGGSEEARFIINPNILVALEYPFSFSNYPSEEWCADETINMQPDSMEYNRNKKEIKVYYNRLPFPTNDGYSFYQFNGLNARDFGYKYAYVDLARSTFKPIFLDNDNIGNNVIELQNYLHTGGSCGVDGGCNNGSPRQSYLEFKQVPTNYSNSNGEIYIKLWKNYPQSVDSPADIIEKIIIREY